MAQNVNPVSSREPVTVGVLTTTVVDAVSMRGNERCVLWLYNPSLVDTFVGSVEVSPDGEDPFYTYPDDGFASLGPGEAGYVIVPADFQFVRVRGVFGLGAGPLYKSVFMQRAVQIG